MKQAVERLYGCEAEFVEIVVVAEFFQNEPVGEDRIYNHPASKQAYACSAHIDGTNGRKFFAVLRDPPIESAADAIQRAIVQQHWG